MSRVLKQLIYGAVYLALMLLIVWGVYNIWFNKAPSGPCSSSCIASNPMIDTTSTSPMSLQAGLDQSVVLATFKNSSSEYGAKFSYSITIYNIIGQQIDAFAGTSSVSPADSRYLVFTGILSNASDIGKISLSTSNVTWVPAAQVTNYDLSVTGINTSISQNGGFVSGTLDSSSTTNLADVQLTALIYSTYGQVIGADKIDVGGLAALAKQPFQIPFPNTDAKTAASIDNTRTKVFYEVTQN